MNWKQITNGPASFCHKMAHAKNPKRILSNHNAMTNNTFLSTYLKTKKCPNQQGNVHSVTDITFIHAKQQPFKIHVKIFSWKKKLNVVVMGLKEI